LLIQGIANGLQYLHEQQFVHLDLKPNNVLIDSGMNPKITDWYGRARMLGQGDGATIHDTHYLLAGTM
jgi:L1 cell adhesion molecule like protein